MPRTRDEFDEDDEDDAGKAGDALDERELPDESDMDDAEEPDVIACPYCRKSISDQAEWCHHCGHYLSREDAPNRAPVWIVAAVVFAALAALMWVMR